MRRTAPAWRVLLAAVLLSTAAAVPACAPRATTAAAAEAGAWLREELYFGTAIPGGGEVSDTEWAGFFEREIEPRFPAGLTVLDAEGRWRNADGSRAAERTRIVIILRRAGDTDADRAIGAIVAEYVRAFRQESVLRVTGRVDARF